MPLQQIFASIVRFVAGNPRQVVEAGPRKDGAEVKVDLRNYCYIDEFTPHATESLVQRFKKAGIRFELGFDVAPPDETGPDEGGCYAERRTVSVYVHREDEPKSRQLIGDK
jgi:hypothetical protein